MKKISFQCWLKGATEEERIKVANDSGTTVAYLWQLAGKHRKPSISLAAKLNNALNEQVDIGSLLPELSELIKVPQ